ncbi:hypothetical protein NDU88_006640 [Pleurodeles waltl]|uniref:Uncharacterized protein n=1 Tax=Pleurodeles waltl TaxID=8319 RepID=A0AAV7RMT7_PLEWA|nr:hypothetical protein NDU88_006640 [Pleurodeles waltl]
MLFYWAAVGYPSGYLQEALMWPKISSGFDSCASNNEAGYHIAQLYSFNRPHKDKRPSQPCTGNGSWDA